MFLYVREACKYTDKENYVAMYRKNNICISCVFNGFKYIYHSLTVKHSDGIDKKHFLSHSTNMIPKYNFYISHVHLHFMALFDHN